MTENEMLQKLAGEKTEVKTEEVKVTSKKVQYIPTASMDYVFDEVVNEQGGQLNFKNFDFAVFKGLDKEIQEAIHEYKLIEADKHKYSKEYLSEARINALIKVNDIKAKYKAEALKQIKEIRTPSINVKTMTQHEEQMNMLKRLNNNIIASELMKTASVEELKALWELNKDNVDVRTMLKSRSFHLYRVTKHEGVKRQAMELHNEIKAYERELKNPAFLDELDSLEANVNYVFEKDDMYPEGLENGFESMKFKKLFE